MGETNVARSTMSQPDRVLPSGWLDVHENVGDSLIFLLDGPFDGVRDAMAFAH